MTAEKYLLDANILIAPSNSYYSFELAPGFWPQMNASSKGQVFKKVKIPDVANHFGIPYNDLFYFMREMGIRWK